MAVAQVAQRVQFGSSSNALQHLVTISSAGSITVGNHLILASVYSSFTDILTVTDPRGNTWQEDRFQSSGTSHTVYLLSCKVTNAYTNGDQLQFDIASGSNRGFAVIGAEFSGLHATTWYAGGNSGTGTLGNFASGATGTAAAAGDLVFGGVAFGSTGVTSSPTAESNTPTAWTALTKQGTTGGAAIEIHAHRRIVDGAESPNYDGSSSGGGAPNTAAAIGVYRVAAGGGGGGARSFAVIVA